MSRFLRNFGIDCILLLVLTGLVAGIAKLSGVLA